MLRTIAKGVNYSLGKVLQAKKIFVSGSLEFLGRKQVIDNNYYDYVRLSTLELVSYEINSRGLTGSVAELGVYKGKFARYINQYFPERPFYLFDTFEGFDQRDVAREIEQNLSTGAQNFSDTTVGSVLKRMPFPQKCIPKVGFFPDSAAGVADGFVFVSLDADLFEPIYSGLNFFYPKLAKGGYIFVHDFNNDNYKGSRKAVEQFCRENGVGYVPIPDSGGSAILCK
jgi:O-methyltransferase